MSDTCVLRAASGVVFIERKTENIFDKSQEQLLQTGHLAAAWAASQPACDGQTRLAISYNWTTNYQTQRAVCTVNYYIRKSSVAKQVERAVRGKRRCSRVSV